MGHRHVSNPFTISGLHQQDNNHSPVEHRIPMAVGTGNGQPFVAPVDMLRGGVYSDPRWNSSGRSDGYHSSNVSMEVQAFSRPPINPYTHSSMTGNTSLPPVTHVHGGVLNSTPDNGGGTFKRKSPGSSSNFYGAGSSSSSHMLTEKPGVDCHGLPPYRNPNLSIVGENSTRNVRRRSGLELETCMTRNHVPSYTSHYYQTTHSVPVHPVNLNADVTNREWNSVPRFAVSSHGRTSPPDINGPRHETNQFHAGGSSVDIAACHSDPFFSRNYVPHVSHSQPTRNGHSYHSRRVTPSYGSGPSYSYYTHGGSSSSGELHFPMENSSSIYPRRSSAEGWGSGYRSGRQFQPIADMRDPHDRFGHAPTLMVDRLSFYNSSRNLLDEYQDMMLDVDSMSYEELLALEERIGDVSTGLSEDRISKCLTEQVYCCVDENHEEAACPICLEEYENGEKVGRIEKCGHEYHMDCIKKWLVMKKLCPICKSECST